MTDTNPHGKDTAGFPVSNQISGGVFFHAVVQGRDITVQLPPHITPALSGLPPASTAFTGRDEQVKDLLEVLAPGAGPQKPVLVAAVAGLAGVGKTELAVQTAARALRQPGWFPGGVLFIDMFGYDAERRLSPEHALDGLLHALGIPGEHIPAELQDRSRLYRSVLAAFAEQRRRILVVIDNVSTAEQARPLLPTDGATAALLTSRHTLDLDARLHDLDSLDEAASVELLRQVLLQARGPADTRVQDAPEHAATIARLCAGLPLALRIAAASLADVPTRPLASLAQALEAAHTRLDRLRREDRAVRAAFDLSYQRLSGDHARLFRLLPLHAGPDLSTESAAHLADTDQPRAEELLQDLARAHLIDPGRTWGRWRLHDLVRLYADQHGHTHTDTDQRATAQVRLHTYYITTTQAADTHVTSEAAPSARFTDRHDAFTWLEDERLNLLATATAPPPLGHPDTTTALAIALVQYLNLRHHFDDLLTVASTALALSRERGDRRGEAKALYTLGMGLFGMRQFEEALDAHTTAMDLAAEVNDVSVLAVVMHRRGETLSELRRFEEALDIRTAVVDIFRALGSRLWEGIALAALGAALENVGRHEEAIDAYTNALAIHRELGDRISESITLGNLGGALREVGRYEEAIDAKTNALDIHQELGNRHDEAREWNNLGNMLWVMDRFSEAIKPHNTALAIYRELGDRYGEAQALGGLGAALVELPRPVEGLNTLIRAVKIYRELGDRHAEADALSRLAASGCQLGRFAEAAGSAAASLRVYRQLGDRPNEAHVLLVLGIAQQDSPLHTKAQAADSFAQAAAIFRELGDHEKEAGASALLHAVQQEMRARETPPQHGMDPHQTTTARMQIAFGPDEEPLELGVGDGYLEGRCANCGEPVRVPLGSEEGWQHIRKVPDELTGTRFELYRPADHETQVAGI
ncbi:tetratricopeptide repeat protein [Streptomyces sp. PSKA54]|uniref:Tetratricopeptide repeat protein n=1 Tax=Streptomyces himalayensis subsp. aureolus TaxID=2758039 RepID=A0A7W2D3D6_9ACTN|nr:tetratricopeptide repeat protein [Streptomyces himalayensis]MBA4864019.1 tetratricopeptide repeat protein [Streptomyces himalayensis subsp. aureolus]